LVSGPETAISVNLVLTADLLKNKSDLANSIVVKIEGDSLGRLGVCSFLFLEIIYRSQITDGYGPTNTSSILSSKPTIKY
jgi:hypothetical protein